MTDVTENTIVDAVRETPSSTAEPPVVLAGRYQLRRILGRGGMGTVYSCYDLELAEDVALKSMSRTAKDGEALERLRAEVKLARRVTHRNVARTYDVGDHEGTRFITMELVIGQSLRELLATALPTAHAISLLEQLSAGLAAIHEAGVIHRDLKPDNVLVSSSGEAKITDFGIALLASTEEHGMSSGTPNYMAPEVLAGAPPTSRADLYALGVLAWELFVGTRFPRDGLPAGSSRLEILRDRMSAEHEELADMIARCMATAPEDRPESASVVHELAVRIARGARASEGLRANERQPVAARTSVRARVGVATLRADGVDPWLATSLPAEIARALGRAPELQVMSTLIPADDTSGAARSAELDAVVVGTVRAEAEGLVRASLRLVSLDDDLQVWAQSVVFPVAHAIAEMRDAAASITEALAAEPPDESDAPVVDDPRVTELVLRASHEDHSPWREFQSEASTLLEQALALAPDDPSILASLAGVLLSGAGIYDEERYLRARRAAERAVALSPRHYEAQFALGLAQFIANEQDGAIAAMDIALRACPSLANAHAIMGAIAGDVGMTDQAIGRQRLALALDPRLAISRTTCALACELSGQHAACDELLGAGLAQDAPFAQWFCAAVTMRVAMWRTRTEPAAAAAKGGGGAVETACARLARVAQLPLVGPLLGALSGKVSPHDVILSLGPLAAASPSWGRQRAHRHQFEAELNVFAKDYAAAAASVEQLVQTGTCDATWMQQCPLVHELAEHVDLTDARARVAARAAASREALRARAVPAPSPARRRRR